MSVPLNKWLPEELEAARPPELLSISQWASRYRVLGRHSFMKGPYLIEMVPHLAAIMDRIQDPFVETGVLCKPAQIGGTDMGLNFVGYYAHQEPSPIMVILADQGTAEYVCNERIKVMIEVSPVLRRLINPGTYTRSEITLINGSYISIAWASSVSKLASRPVRIVIFDEVDKPGYNLSTREADAISLGRERANTFPDRKFIELSTPTDEYGNITVSLATCDVVYDWHVPCHACGQLQPLRWSGGHAYGFEDGKYRAEDGNCRSIGRVVWDGGNKAGWEDIQRSARYECGECGSLWSTAQKNEAVRRGRLVPRTDFTGTARKVGFHLNRLYSLFDGGRLEVMVASFLDAHRMEGEKRQKALQGFVNSSLSEPWVQRIVATSAARILQARLPDLAPQTVPQEAVALTCFVDCQKYGFWYSVRAWARDFTSWLIHYGYIQTWDDVEALLFETEYPVADTGEYMRIWRAAVDTGGGEGEDHAATMTEEAYFWLRRNSRGRGCRVWGTKGSSKPLASGFAAQGRPIDRTPSGKPLPGGLQLVMLDSQKLKDAYHARLDQAIEEGGPRSLYLHRGTDELYASHILAEEKRREKGLLRWVKVAPRNDLLDCECGNIALADPSWPGGGINVLRGSTRYGGEAASIANPPRRMVKSRWMGG